MRGFSIHFNNLKIGTYNTCTYNIRTYISYVYILQVLNIAADDGDASVTGIDDVIVTNLEWPNVLSHETISNQIFTKLK